MGIISNRRTRLNTTRTISASAFPTARSKRATYYRLIYLVCLSSLIGSSRSDAFDRQEHSMKRAGNPQNVAHWAIPSPNHRYVGYYVGGGTTFGGEPRQVDDGVWGVDYQGGFLPRRVIQTFSHGRRYQGGTGAYKTDGPRVKPIGHLRKF